MPIGSIAILTSDGVVTDANEAFVRLVGCSERGEALGRPIRGFFVHTDEWDRLSDRLTRRESILEYGAMLIKKDGHHVDTLQTISPRTHQPHGFIRGPVGRQKSRDHLSARDTGVFRKNGAPRAQLVHEVGEEFERRKRTRKPKFHPAPTLPVHGRLIRHNGTTAPVR